MTVYVIRLTSGGYVGIREGGIFRHVDKASEAHQFGFATTALGVAIDFDLALDAFEVEPFEEARQ